MKPSHWFPDETLFSLASRHHLLSGNSRSWETAVELFGHPRPFTVHGMPVWLDQFIQRMPVTLGPVESIVRERTLLPFYLPFAPAEYAQAAIDALRGDGLACLRASKALAAWRFGAKNNPLRACLRCMQRDLSSFQVCYWHRDHQWPGAWICGEHDDVLCYEAAAPRMHHWRLPQDVRLVDPMRPGAAYFPAGPMRDMSQFARGLGKLPAGTFFEPKVLAQTYRCRAEARSNCCGNRGRTVSSFNKSVAGVCSALRKVPGMEAFARTGPRYFSRLLRNPQMAAHPLRHLLLALALFESWSTFVDAYKCQANRLH